MKFYEASTPYMALIKAKDINQAKEEYKSSVADDEGDLDLKEVSAIYASAKFSRALGEKGEVLPLEEVLDDLTNHYSMTLIVDPDLI